jgi:hypothetical protein
MTLSRKELLIKKSDDRIYFFTGKTSKGFNPQGFQKNNFNKRIK